MCDSRAKRRVLHKPVRYFLNLGVCLAIVAILDDEHARLLGSRLF